MNYTLDIALGAHTLRCDVDIQRYLPATRVDPEQPSEFTVNTAEVLITQPGIPPRYLDIYDLLDDLGAIPALREACLRQAERQDLI